MDYVYDIVLDFQPKYYEFYEWKTDDKIINVKRIPIYKIDSLDYLNIMNNSIIIDRESIPKSNKMFLLTNGILVMGILINDDGNVLKKSSLLFTEADDILEDKELIKYIKIKYNIIKKYNNNFISRAMEEKNSYINKYLSNLDKEKDEYLLKYLYFEIFGNEEDNIDIVYDKLYKLMDNDIIKLYDGIKKVNLELKR